MLVPALTSLNEEVWLGCGRFEGMRVGSLDGVGDGGGGGLRDVACLELAAAAFAAAVVRVAASRGILFGP